MTFDPEQPVLETGAVYIGDDERIHAVQEDSKKAPAGFEHARRLDTHGVVYPGLIDLHSHVVYNGIPLWSPPGRDEPYTSRAQWPRDPSYDAMVSDPGRLIGYVAGKAQLKYAEVKAIVGGVTAIQGSARTGRVYEGWLARNVEEETFTTGKSNVFQSVVTLHTSKERDPFESARAHMTDGNAFIYHLSEGTSPKLVEEWEALREHDCLQPGLVAIHATALKGPQFREWATHRGSIVWSPLSNLWLYGDTTDVVSAQAEGLRVCLGSDWAPSGSRSLLGELKVADLVNRTKFDGGLSDEELCAMATRNPADALSWSERLGRLKPGLHGDVLVMADRGGDPYRSLIEATERDVLFTAINGYPMYGTPELMRAAGAEEGSEPIRVAGRRMRIVLVYDWIEDADWGWEQVVAELEDARRDPRAYLERHPKGEGPHARLELRADKPFDAPKDINFDAEIPPLEGLATDKAFLAAIRAGGFHGGALNALADYYAR